MKRDSFRRQVTEQRRGGIWSALNYVTPSKVLSAQRALWPEQKSCDFEYLSFFFYVSGLQCLALLFTALLRYDVGLLRAEQSIGRGRREEKQRKFHIHCTKRWAPNDLFTLIRAHRLVGWATVVWHTSTHWHTSASCPISILSWLTEKLCSFLIQFIALVNISLR